MGGSSRGLGRRGLNVVVVVVRIHLVAAWQAHDSETKEARRVVGERARDVKSSPVEIFGLDLVPPRQVGMLGPWDIFPDLSSTQVVGR